MLSLCAGCVSGVVRPPLLHQMAPHRWFSASGSTPLSCSAASPLNGSLKAPSWYSQVSGCIRKYVSVGYCFPPAWTIPRHLVGLSLASFAELFLACKAGRFLWLHSLFCSILPGSTFVVFFFVKNKLPSFCRCPLLGPLKPNPFRVLVLFQLLQNDCLEPII